MDSGAYLAKGNSSRAFRISLFDLLPNRFIQNLCESLCLLRASLCQKNKTLEVQKDLKGSDLSRHHFTNRFVKNFCESQCLLRASQCHKKTKPSRYGKASRVKFIRHCYSFNSKAANLDRLNFSILYFIGEKGNAFKYLASTFSTILPLASEASRTLIHSGSVLNRSKAASKAARSECPRR